MPFIIKNNQVVEVDIVEATQSGQYFGTKTEAQLALFAETNTIDESLSNLNKSIIDAVDQYLAPKDESKDEEKEDENIEVAATNNYPPGFPKRVYRKDSPNGEEVFNQQQLDAALANGYSLSSVDLRNEFDSGSASDIVTAPAAAKAPEKGLSARAEAKLRFPYLSDELIDVYTKAYVDTGDSTLALLTMRSDPAMEKYYPGIRKTDGTLRMTEQEYTVAKEAMQLNLRNYNLNPQVFDDDIVQAISGDVSVQEFSDRLEAGYQGIVNNIPQVRDVYLREFNLDLNEETIFGMFISPQLSTKVLENQIRTSQIIAEAETALGASALATKVALGFAQQGITQRQAREAFQEAAGVLPGISRAAAAQAREDITAAQYLEATRLGQAEYQQRLGRITQQLLSASSVQAGAATTRTGEVTGLIEA